MKYLTLTTTLLALLIRTALLAISLAGCSAERESILQPCLPAIHLTEQDIHPQTQQFAYAITATEPLPYPISLRVDITSRVFADGDLHPVYYNHVLTLKSGSQTVYGFYDKYFYPEYMLNSVEFFDRDSVKLDCVSGSARSLGIPTDPRGFNPVVQVKIILSHPDPDDEGRCEPGGAYTIESSRLTLRAPDRLIEVLFPEPHTRPWKVR